MRLYDLVSNERKTLIEESKASRIIKNITLNKITNKQNQKNLFSAYTYSALDERASAII